MNNEKSEQLVSQVKLRWEALAPELNERQRRRWVAAEAITIGHGGQTIVFKATGVACSTIARGVCELKESPVDVPRPIRQRKQGGGRKSVLHHYPNLDERILALVESGTRGDPENPLCWTLKSISTIHAQLSAQGIPASPSTIQRRLRANHYSLRLNRRVLSDGAQHPDRNAQFEFINATAKESFAAGNPVISIDTKKTELIGNYANKGTTWCPKDAPVLVRDHEFYNDDAPKAHPYGIHDPNRNIGYVVVGSGHDTAEFAVSSLRRWWTQAGLAAYPNACHIQINADCGGSNGYRVRLWKWELQRFADESGLTLKVRHYPPGTSKWNPIEHRLFSFISLNWRGHPLDSYETVVNLIGATTNKKNLRVTCQLDPNSYPTGKKISDAQYAQIHHIAEAFCPDWNYEIRPQNLTK